MKYYLSDLHIGHSNVIRYDGRPFRNLDEMHETIIRNWNSTVSPQDEVYLLGDFAMKNAAGLEVMQQLQGIKYLIQGNHDHPTEALRNCFVWVKDYAQIYDHETCVVLCHYPIAHWYHQYRDSVHLYGHVHNTQDEEAFRQYREICRKLHIPFRAYNTGCMLPYMRYTPRTLQEILQTNEEESNNA